eukprot:g29946.t1
MQDVPTEGRHLQAYLTQTEDPGNFLYIPSREHLGRQEAEDFRDPTQDVKEHAEPVKVLGELVKVDPADRAASRPPSQASTAAGTFSRPPTAGDSRPSSAVVEEEYMYWCDQVGQDPLPPGGVPPPEADNPRFVDDWRHVRREVEVRETEWQGEVKRSLAGRKSLIIRKSLEFLDEACKQTALLRAPQAVAVLHQKCNKITLEILVNYFKMQGLLMEFRTAPILSTLPADLPSWVDQEPVLSLEDTGIAQILDVVQEGYPVLRPSFDSFTTAPSDMDLPQPGPATALNGAIIALQVLLNEAPNTEAGDLDPRTSARRSPVASTWDALPPGQASVRRPAPLRGQASSSWLLPVAPGQDCWMRTLKNSTWSWRLGVSLTKEHGCIPKECVPMMSREFRQSCRERRSVGATSKQSGDTLSVHFTPRPWTRLEGKEKQSASETSQMRKDEIVISELVRQLLSALAHGHAQGCVHGMITPEKVRQQTSKKSLQRQARWMSKSFRGDLPEVSKATPRLSVQPESGPPEEVKQRSQLDLHLIDGHLRGLAPAGADKADIWAVGALAFRLLTGVPPFCPPEGSKKEIVGMMQTEPIKFSKKDWSKRSSKCLDAIQCMLRACTLPPAKAREEEVIWYAFRAFDEADDVTIEKVLLMARLLEGQLISREQIEELITVLQSELSRIRVPLKLERPTLETEAEASESSGTGESDDEDDESLQDGAVPRVSMGSRPTISGNSSMMGSGRLPPRLPPNKEKEKSKEGFMQRKWQGLVEKTRSDTLNSEHLFSASVAMELCLAPFRAWLRCTSQAEEKASHALGSMSKLCAKNPWKCIALSLLCCLLLGLGFLRFESESAAQNLWVDQESQQMMNTNWVNQYFEGADIPARLVVTAKDGGNILEIAKMQEIFGIVDNVRALVDEQGWKLEDVCLWATSDCFIGGVVRYFGSTANFNQTVQNQADILQAVNSATFPDGGEAYASDSLGGIQRVNGSITSATAARVDFILWANYDDAASWGYALLNHFVENDLTKQRYQTVNVYVMTDQSMDDELNRTVQADIPLFVLAFVLMSTFCAIFLGKAWSWTQSRRLLGMAEFFLVIFGVVAGYGTCMLIGVKFTVLTQILPFILVGIGIDDAFVISGAFDAADKTLSIPDRMGKAIERVGVSITLTKLTSLASFLLGATCVFPAVQWFCFYAASSCFFLWLLHLTAFCAMLTLDAQRAAAHRLDPLPCIAARNMCMPGVLPFSGEKDQSAVEDRLGAALGAMIRVITSHPAGIILTLVIFLALAGVSAWQVSLGLGTDFDIMDLSPDNSYLRDFYNKDQGSNSRPSVQRHIEQVGAEMLAMKSINAERGLYSWHTAFTLWANQNRGANGNLPSDAFVSVESDREGCSAGLPSGVTTCASHFLTGPTFVPALLEFLETPWGSRFTNEVVIANNEIQVMRLGVEMGQPIFLGVSTTFLAILPLAFSSSQAFRVFFKMFFGIVLAGGSHGLIFMPVLLSIMGPTVRWVTRPRPLDFGEFVFLCDTRRKGVGPGKLLYRVARKELFRIFLKHDLDFYEVVHKVPDFDWPPKAGDVARTPNSCHFATGGLYSKQQQAGDDAEELPEEAEVTRLRDERSNLQQQLKSPLVAHLKQKACSAQVRFLASTDVESRSAHFSLQRLGREELLFLLKEVSCAGERDRQLWKVYSKKAHQMLCDIVRALCRVHYHRWSLLNAVKRRMRSREIQSLSPRRFTQLLSDLRRLNFVDGPMLQDVLKHWQFEEKIQELDAFDLCLLLIAFARCSMREEEPAAGSLYAMALLDYQDDTAFFLAAKALPRCLGHASQQELVNIAFALVVLDLPAAELFSFALERLALQADTLEPVAVHALRIVAHAVKFPEALRPAMRNSLEVPEIKGRSVKALQEVLGKTQHMAIQCATTSSKLQRAIERYFKELQVQHLPEQAVGPYVPDFILPKKIAVEVDGFTHFYAFSQRLTAKSELKRRIFNALGWGVVSLPHFKWLPMNHQERRFATRKERREKSVD